ncbi:hypothetical protein C5167_028396 [Papaver somniferum]|nr:hypothetical protein C5167_028396 [Papaver somniferum]
MFPSGQSFDDETSVPSGQGKRVVPPGNDTEMENMEEKTESVCNVVPDHVTERSEVFASPNDALEMEVSDLPLERCMRIVPQDQNTGALFIAILQKVSPLVAVSSSTEAKEGDANSLDVSLDEGNQLSPLLSYVASGTESSYKRPENGASGLDSHVVVRVENEKEDAKNETDPMIAGGNWRMENQGMWRVVAPTVFTREATVLSNTMDFLGISNSFPLNEHLATQNTDFQSCKRNYYISKSVRDVMKLNVQVGQQLKIVSVGVEAIVEQDDAHKVSCKRRRRHGTTIIGGSNDTGVFIISDGFEADPVRDVNEYLSSGQEIQSG